MNSRQANILKVSVTLFATILGVVIYFLDKSDDKRDQDQIINMQQRMIESNENITFLLDTLTKLFIVGVNDPEQLSQFENRYDSIIVSSDIPYNDEKGDSILALIKKLKSLQILQDDSRIILDSIKWEQRDDSSKARKIWGS